jgi:hypothetical protein
MFASCWWMSSPRNPEAKKIKKSARPPRAVRQPKKRPTGASGRFPGPAARPPHSISISLPAPRAGPELRFRLGLGCSRGGSEGGPLTSLPQLGYCEAICRGCGEKKKRAVWEPLRSLDS